VTAGEAWSVDVTAGAERALERLPEKIATAVVEFITGPLAENPKRLSKPLRAELEGWHTAPRGHYRVTFQIDEDAHRLVIGRIEHRATVYRRR
jgi:mRNA-degrading endonuclease RelE of RelBE toxin-antitoxin system